MDGGLSANLASALMNEQVILQGEAMKSSYNRHDTWDVQSAARILLSQAAALATRHLRSGHLRLLFNREMADYLRHLVNEVERGQMKPEHGMQVLRNEHHLLLQQSAALRTPSVASRASSLRQGDPTGSLPPRRPARPVQAPDPHRLQRYIGAQQRYIAEQSQPRAPVTRPAPIDLRPPYNPPVAVEYHDPGFYIVPKSTTAAKLEADLFVSPSAVVLAKFRSLNPGLDQVKAGQMIVLSDPANHRCTREEAQLMATASEVGKVLEDLTPEEADFLARHREEIESFLTHGSTSIGIGEAVFAKHLGAVKQLMLEIESLHTQTLARDGHLRSPEFFTERKRLLIQLDSHLTPLTKKGIGFPDHPKLKTALGISTRSLVHRYGRAGGYGQNPGYATRLKAVTRAAKYVKYGGWIGTTLGAGASVMKVQDVCAAGDAEACERIKYTETGAFLGALAGGAATSGALVSGAGAVCIALGVPTLGAGAVACGVVVVGAGSLAIGIGTGKLGEIGGEMIYEARK